MRYLFRRAITAQRGAAVGEGLLVHFRDLGGHAGIDWTGADAVDGNPLLAQLHRQRTCQPGDARLGGAIGTVARSCPQRFGTGNVDDPRAGRTAQVRQSGADQPLVSGEQHRHRAVPNRVVTVIVDRTEGADPGIVDQRVKTAELRSDFIDHMPDRGMIGHVKRPAPRRITLGTQLLGNALNRFGRQIRQSHIGALGSEDFGRRPAHPARRAGYQHGQPVHRTAQFQSHRSCSLVWESIVACQRSLAKQPRRCG